MPEITSSFTKNTVFHAVLAALKTPSSTTNTGPRGTPTPGAPGTPPSHYEKSKQNAVERFIEVSNDYKAHVTKVHVSQLPSHLADLVANANVKSMVVPEGLQMNWLSELKNVNIFVDNGSLSHSTLAKVESVVSGCSHAIASTGTLALTGKADEGRRVLTLLPDYHFCIVKASSILDDVSDLFEILSPRLPITLISGPSATSDIELKRVEGVHGPRNLYIVVLAD